MVREWYSCVFDFLSSLPPIGCFKILYQLQRLALSDVDRKGRGSGCGLFHSTIPVVKILGIFRLNDIFYRPV
jgi:hypothetical protein